MAGKQLKKETTKDRQTDMQTTTADSPDSRGREPQQAAQPSSHSRQAALPERKTVAARLVRKKIKQSERKGKLILEQWQMR